MKSDKVRIKEAVKYFGLSDSFFRHAIMDKTIPFYKLGGCVFVSISEIEKLIEKGKIK